MTVAVVQVSAAAAAWAGGLNSAPTLPGNSTSGNRIILPWAHQQFDNNSTAVAASGYTSRQSVNQAANIAAVGVLDKAAAGAAETPTAAATTAGASGSSFGASVLLEVSGLDSTAPYVAADSATASGITAAQSVSSGNPLSQASGIAIVAYSTNTSMAGGTWPPTNVAWVDIHSGLTSEYAFAYFVFSSTAQLIAALTITSAAEWAGMIAIYKAASGTSGVSFRKTLSRIGTRVGARQLQA